MRILLIEDDPVITGSIELMLRSENFHVRAVALGEDGVHLGKLNEHDLILLDLNLPDMSGYDVLRSLRTAMVKTPTLILSGLASVESKVKGLGFGADDYLTKPFHKDELIGRIHAVLRRSATRSDVVVKCGDLVINLEAQRASIGDKVIRLTNKEFQMLELMALRYGSSMTKEMFLSHLYGGLDEPGFKIIDVFICKLRKKLADASGGKHYIETVWGRGYTLREHSAHSAGV
jgi:two-component system, cell cycle response regulator CtrA